MPSPLGKVNTRVNSRTSNHEKKMSAAQKIKQKKINFYDNLSKNVTSKKHRKTVVDLGAHVNYEF